MLRPSIPTSLTISIDAVTLGGAVLQAVGADLRADGPAWRIDKLDFRAPGFAKIGVTGRLDRACQGDRLRRFGQCRCWRPARADRLGGGTAGGGRPGPDQALAVQRRYGLVRRRHFDRAVPLRVRPRRGRGPAGLCVAGGGPSGAARCRSEGRRDRFRRAARLCRRRVHRDSASKRRAISRSASRSAARGLPASKHATPRRVSSSMPAACRSSGCRSPISATPRSKPRAASRPRRRPAAASRSISTRANSPRCWRLPTGSRRCSPSRCGVWREATTPRSCRRPSASRTSRRPRRTRETHGVRPDRRGSSRRQRDRERQARALRRHRSRRARRGGRAVRGPLRVRRRRATAGAGRARSARGARPHSVGPGALER